MTYGATGQENAESSLQRCLDVAHDSVLAAEVTCVEAMSGLRDILRCENLEEAKCTAMSALIKAGHHLMPSDEVASRLRFPQELVDAVLLSHHDETT